MGKDIYVFADWEHLRTPTLVGILHSEVLRGKEIFSFEYDHKWLNSQRNSFLDPDLQLYRGRQYPQNKELFGIFTDSCPDRWGRLLMKRREAIIAKDEGRSPRTLLESDYLLGIQDVARMGALRFKTLMDGPFLDIDAAHVAFVVIPQVERGVNGHELGDLQHLFRDHGPGAGSEQDDQGSDQEQTCLLHIEIYPLF